MDDEIQRIKLRMRAAAANAGGYSPLGGNNFKHSYQHFRTRYDGTGTTKEGGMHFERVTITPEDHVRSKADGEMRGRKAVLERMNERRRVRKEQQQQEKGKGKGGSGGDNDPKGCFREFANGGSSTNDSSCSIM